MAISRKRVIDGLPLVLPQNCIAGHVARMGEKRNVHRLLVGKPEGKRREWTDNIKMDLLEIELCVVDWIGLARDGYSWRVLVFRGYYNIQGLQ
jgi:hypothetical protein